MRKNDIAILEGTYNCIEDELKKELVPYNIKIEPAEVWSPFFFRWQFMCDWNVFETCGDFINIASKIIGNERLMKKIIDDKIDYVLPVNYKVQQFIHRMEQPDIIQIFHECQSQMFFHIF